MGDINPTIPFYSPSISGGILYRYNVNKRYVFKGEINYLQTKASDFDFTDPYRTGRAKNFSSSLYDISAQFEFNFLPLKFEARKIGFTPFVSSGLAMAYIMNNQYVKSINLVFPFALGIKTSIGEKWCLGFQWNFRKMFTDKFDGIVNPIEKKYNSSFNNNDWYSFAGIFLTYKMFDYSGDCPAYKDSY